MTLKSLIVKTKCDNGCCQNVADFVVEREDTPNQMRLHLCTACVKELAALFCHITKCEGTPKNGGKPEQNKKQKRGRY